VESFQFDTGDRLEAIDITDRVGQIVAASGVSDGLVVVSAGHTTVGLIVNEYVPDLMRDLEGWIERIAPRNDAYSHPSNADAHLRAALFGSAVTLPFAAGRVILGTWQRVILLEFDGPRRRTIHVQIVGE
jgi:secondary thiamine-phosphate synthase enzyme